MTEVKADLTELKDVAQEIFNLNAQLKKLRLRKKELEASTMDYLDKTEKNGIRLGNIVFIIGEKNARARKKKADVEKDTAEVLKKYGVPENEVAGALKDLDESRKGEQSSMSVLKMKAAGIFE